ncbi:MAG: uroporphyrinogen-III synthase [Candidatus Nanopelagicales bacterium]
MTGAGAGRILLIRPDGNEADAQALDALGLPSWIDPYLQVAPTDPATGEKLLVALGEAVGWVLIASPRTLRRWAALVGADRLRAALAGAAEAGWRFGVVGAATARALGEWVTASALVPSEQSAAGLLRELPPGPARALLPGSAIARPELAAGLRARGWDVLAAPVYRTAAVRAAPPSAAPLSRGELPGVVLRSPSAARAMLLHARPPAATLLVAAGPTTQAAASEQGLFCLLAPSGTPAEVAATLAEALRRRSTGSPTCD